MKSELDESFAIDVLRQLARAQLVAHGVGERGAAPGRTLALFRTHYLGPPRIEMKVKRLPLVVAQRLVVEIAQDVAGNIADDEPHDLVVDAALAAVERVANRFVERCRRETGAGQWGEVDPRAGRRQRMKRVSLAASDRTR